MYLNLDHLSRPGSHSQPQQSAVVDDLPALPFLRLSRGLVHVKYRSAVRPQPGSTPPAPQAQERIGATALSSVQALPLLFPQDTPTSPDPSASSPCLCHKVSPAHSMSSVIASRDTVPSNLLFSIPCPCTYPATPSVLCKHHTQQINVENIGMKWPTFITVETATCQPQSLDGSSDTSPEAMEWSTVYKRLPHIF